MSIPVEIGNLLEALKGFGAGYLLTTTEGRGQGGHGRARRSPTPVCGSTVRAAGRVANLAANPAVTLVFPPLEPRGYTLLVDGTAARTATTWW